MTRTRFDRSSTTIDYFADLDQVVALAVAEDLGAGDLTALLIPANTMTHATVVVREQAVLCGTRWFDAVYRSVDPAVEVSWLAADGDTVHPDQTLCRLSGRARALVSGERTALNFLQTLSGTASVAARHAAELAGTRTRLLDTRKTLPGLRRAQKYAVRCGGGFNHRCGLFDGVLIKENHIAAAGGVGAAIRGLRQAGVTVPIEVEVEQLSQIEEAIAAGADMLLLDNFDLATMAKAVSLTAGRVPLEASGGFGLEDLKAVAATGVDYISSGTLTKHVRAIDLSMRIADPV